MSYPTITRDGVRLALVAGPFGDLELAQGAANELGPSAALIDFRGCVVRQMTPAAMLPVYVAQPVEGACHE